MGVAEYFLFDPVGGKLDPRLRGYALRDGAYRPMPPEVLAHGERGVRSEVLGLCAYLRRPGHVLRWRDPATGRTARRPKKSRPPALRRRGILPPELSPPQAPQPRIDRAAPMLTRFGSTPDATPAVHWMCDK